MNRQQKDKYLGKPTKAVPRRSDQTVNAKSVAVEGNCLSDKGLRDQAVHMMLLKIHFSFTDARIQETLRHAQIQEARELGATWQEIGDAYGVSAQAAWQKYRARGDQPAAGRKPPQAEELPLD